MNWTRSHVATLLNKRATKVFALTWFSFAWFFSSVIPLISDVTRSGGEWLARGVFAGFFVGAITAYFEDRHEQKQLAEALPDEAAGGDAASMQPGRIRKPERRG